MKKTVYIILSFVLFISTNLYSQVIDTLYYDANDKITIDKDFSYYKVITQLENKLKINEYYKSGNLKSKQVYLTEGVKIKLEKIDKLIKSEKIIKNGLFVKYDSEGNKTEELRYFNGKISYLPIIIHENGDTIYQAVDKVAIYPGGIAKFQQFIMQNLKYPIIAQEKGIKGKVYVEFVITKNGEVKYIKLAKGVDPILDKEALRVINLMPKSGWTPAILDDKPVNFKLVFPANFTM